MPKSYGSYIGLTDELADVYDKVMSIPDTMIGTYYRLAPTLPVDARIAVGMANLSHMRTCLLVSPARMER